VSRAVLLSSPAQRDFEALPAETRRRVRTALLALGESNKGDVKKLKGIGKQPSLYRLRVGAYRVIFALTPKEIRVTRIVARSEGYDWL
jgi:mRNA interferase RelE/StbE